MATVAERVSVLETKVDNFNEKLDDVKPWQDELADMTSSLCKTGWHHDGSQVCHDDLTRRWTPARSRSRWMRMWAMTCSPAWIGRCDWGSPGCGWWWVTPVWYRRAGKSRGLCRRGWSVVSFWACRTPWAHLRDCAKKWRETAISVANDRATA
jgi:hypothetical protein